MVSDMTAETAVEKHGVMRRVLDSWQNLFKGKGTSKDARTSTTYNSGPIISDSTLSQLYRSNGIAKKIVNIPVDDMTRNGFKIKGDEDDKVLMRMEELNLLGAANLGQKWARLYGNGIVLMGIDDGGELSEPVNEDAIKDVTSLTVFDRREVEVDQQSLQTDMGKPDFLQPQIYQITPVTGGNTVRVHVSRLMIFRGSELPRKELVENSYWDQSFLQSIYESLRQYGAVYDSAEFIVEDFVQTLIKLKNVMNLMKTKEGQALVKSRLNLFDKSRSVANTLIIDTEEDYSKHASTVTGLDLVMDRYGIKLTGESDIPATKLFGRSPAGENATGAADIRFYYDGLEAAQNEKLRPQLEKPIKYMFLANGGEPEDWTIEFNPLTTMTPKEESELYKLNAEGDAANVNGGIADPDQLEKYRFGGATYNASPPTYEVPDEPEPEPEPPTPPPPPFGQFGAQPPVPGAPVPPPEPAAGEEEE
jgi:phage-related protein (TIGR01555 family)